MNGTCMAARELTFCFIFFRPSRMMNGYFFINKEEIPFMKNNLSFVFLFLFMDLYALFLHGQLL